MTTIKLSFDKERLFDRCRVDVINKSMATPVVSLDMSEHDRVWFEIALLDAAIEVECELSRIARKAEVPMFNDQTSITFEIDPTTDSHATKIADAIEGCIVARVCEEWAVARGLDVRFEAVNRAGHLKHITLKKVAYNV